MICDNIINDKRQNNRQNSYTFPISRRTTQQNLIAEGYFHLGGITSQNERASVELFFITTFLRSTILPQTKRNTVLNYSY